MVRSDQTLVSFVGDMIVDVQIKSGVDLDAAKQVRDDCLMQLLDAFGGRQSYIPSVRKMCREKIIAGWSSGRTIRQLAVDFDMTERQIYNIVASI